VSAVLPTPCARDGKGPGHPDGLPDLIERQGILLPTPTATTYGSNRSQSAGAAWRPSLARLVGDLFPPQTPESAVEGYEPGAGRHSDMGGLLPTPRGSDGAKGSPGQRGSHGDLTLPAAAVQVLPTPTSADGRGGPGGHRGGGPNLRTTVAALPTADESRWGVYTGAVARWELHLGRPVPEPTQPGTHGRPVLAPVFVEWLMGLPHGWVTDLPIPRTLALRVLGNGVVPQQAAVALHLLLCPHRWTTG
jgi:DNA (cytosine-5)-methyltransferase 1